MLGLLGSVDIDRGVRVVLLRVLLNPMLLVLLGSVGIDRGVRVVLLNLLLLVLLLAPDR